MMLEITLLVHLLVQAWGQVHSCTYVLKYFQMYLYMEISTFSLVELVLKYFQMYLYLYISTFSLVELVLKYFTCTCTLVHFH